MLLLVVVIRVGIKLSFTKYFRATLNFPVWNVCYLERHYVLVHMYILYVLRNNVNMTTMLACCIFLLVTPNAKIL